MERIEDLVKVRSEESEIAVALYEAAAAGVEYSQALAFAGLQLRARALEGAAWNAYITQANLERTVRAIVDRHEIRLDAETRVAFYEEMQQLGAETMTRFTLWRDVSALAMADGRDALTPEKAAQGLAAVAWLEDANADEFLKRQNKGKESGACHAELEKEVSA